MKYISLGFTAAVGFGMAGTIHAATPPNSAATLAAPAEAAAGAAAQQQVVVTGTRRSDRTVGESLAPIQVISAKDLNAGGYADIGSSLNALIPSIDFPRQNQGAASIQRPLILRGLSPNQVVVLVDGVRYHTSSTVNLNADIARGSAPVDINSIPLAAVDHIEVLSDGASAQYGSDAIAGVINIVLRKKPRPGSNSIAFDAGVTNKGDGVRKGVSGTWGFDLGGDAHPGWARISLQAQDLGGTNRAGIGTQTAENSPLGIAYQYRGDSPEVNLQGAASFEYLLAPGVTAYGNVLGGRRRDITYGFYRTSGDNRNIPSIYPNGYLPEQVPTSKDVQAVLGLKGTAGAWNWKGYLNYGENKVELRAENTLNVAYYNSFGSTPLDFYLGYYKSSDAQANLELSREFDTGMFHQPLALTLGAEARREGYAIGGGEPSSYYGDTIGSPVGAQVRTGTPPDQTGNWHRNSVNAYADVETSITDKLSGGLAGRYEHYDNEVGSTRSGKLSLRYQFTPAFALRGTASNGFRAPSLAQQYYQSINTSIIGQTLQQSGTYAVSSSAARALGAQALRPERSINYSVGAVWQPAPNLDVTLDAYQITISDAIQYSDRVSMPVGSALANYFNAVVPNQQVTAAQFFINAGKTKTRGVDLIANYHRDLGAYGRLNVLGSANYNKTRVVSLNATDAVVRQYSPSATLYGLGSQALLTDAAPHTKFAGTFNWQVGPWDVTLNETRYGKVTRYPANYPLAAAYLPQQYDARWITNLSVAYKVNRAWTVALGADNLTNQVPTRINATNDQYLKDEIPYDSGLSPFGINGAYYYAKAIYSF